MKTSVSEMKSIPNRVSSSRLEIANETKKNNFMKFLKSIYELCDNLKQDNPWFYFPWFQWCTVNCFPKTENHRNKLFINLEVHAVPQRNEIPGSPTPSHSGCESTFSPEYPCIICYSSVSCLVAILVIRSTVEFTNLRFKNAYFT